MMVRDLPSRRMILACGIFALATGVSPAQAQTAPPPALQSVPAELAYQPLPFIGEIDIDLMSNAQAGSLIAMRDGSLAFTAFTLGAIGIVEPGRQKVQYIHLGKGSRPVSIAENAEGMLFVADKALNVLHRVEQRSGEVSRIVMPPDAPKLDLSGLRIDQTGRIWFAGSAGWLGSHDLGTGQTELSSHDDLFGLGLNASNEAGAIFFVAGRSQRMIRIEPNRARFDSSALPEGFRGARGISVASNGDVWLSAFRGNQIARNSGRGKWQVIALPWPESQPHALLARSDGTVLVADGVRRVLYRYQPQLDRFDEVGKLGDGGQIKAMVEITGGVAISDAGGDRIRLFLTEPQKPN